MVFLWLVQKRARRKNQAFFLCDLGNWIWTELIVKNSSKNVSVAFYFSLCQNE